MTKINDYLWHLPHTLAEDDPIDVGLLQQTFNQVIASALENAMLEWDFQLKSSDVMVKLSDRLDYTVDTYFANVRFIAYLQPDVIIRVHFEHFEWADVLVDSDMHRYAINLDRFKVADPRTQVVVPAWSGRLHTRMSHLAGDRLHHDGEDQIWEYSTADELVEHLQLFLDKFERLGYPWLSDKRTM